ncbi:complement receptor type 1-like isoform X2 [Acipenser ruthenus]|uniref:complement receptor type 1-like isoform X2 n=1 Tax=Acipenser ruthenus TaxID=7906 RepID=UPI00145A98C5|nr:complement receptor type 1-like isoform X2 [Acipenser ruthenus]XP_058860334.1 complement receptor type 1-like isoform X2 [Acipenser ruthenus]XP_058860335.1 complement receptor type 1-like isoform X2 [Acipenser ruthenus]
MSKSAVLLVLVALTVNVNGECDYPPYYDHTILREEYQAHSPSEFIEGFKVAYYCQSGYVRTAGSASITCINKMWSALTLKCERKSCGFPGEILNGNFHSGGGHLFGDEVYAECNEGYQLVGRGTRRCYADGWDGQVPLCESVKRTFWNRFKNAVKETVSEVIHWWN